MKLVLISPCFNAAENLESLIQSVKAQNDSRWHHILVDDISEDNTHEKLLELTASDERYTVIKNDEKKYALRNIVEVARGYQEDDDTAIGVIDGDDSLCNNNTVNLILSEYERNFDVVWTGHRWDVNGANISREMPDVVNPYQWAWCSSHFRTFRSSLLKNVSDRNFKNTDDAWFERGYDQALMLPLLYQTRNRKYIDEVCYLYNIDSVSVNDRDWAEMKQISTINMVRARGFLK
jgi:glycosyltransferase involved in cell wall biosynthesis